MSAVIQSGFITAAEYLLAENDRAGGIRHEYVDGKVYAMEDASRNHSRLAGWLSTRLFNHLEGSPFEVFQSDMKVGIKNGSESYFYYPDIQVSSEEASDDYYNRAPCLIIEVLSNSTARIDRTEKLMAYRQIASLQEYVLCSQDSPSVELHRQSNDWRAEYFVSGDDMLLESVDMIVSIDALYSYLLARNAGLMSLAGAIDEEAADELLNNIRQSRRNKGWNLAE